MDVFEEKTKKLKINFTIAVLVLIILGLTIVLFYTISELLVVKEQAKKIVYICKALSSIPDAHLLYTALCT